MDQRKGLYSYEALHSRLAENTFAQIANVVDYHSPILMLQNLSPEEIYVLLCNIRNVFAGGNKDKYILPDEALRTSVMLTLELQETPLKLSWIFYQLLSRTLI